MKEERREITKQVTERVFICEFCKSEHSQPFLAGRCEKSHIQEKCKHKDINYTLYATGEYDIIINKVCTDCDKELEYVEVSDEDSQEFIETLFNFVKKQKSS